MNGGTGTRSGPGHTIGPAVKPAGSDHSMFGASPESPGLIQYVCQPGAMRCRSPTQNVEPGSIVTESLTRLTVTRGGTPFGAATRRGETARADPGKTPLIRKPTRRATASARVSIAKILRLRLPSLEERAVPAVPFGFELGDGNEAERRRVDAIAQAGRARTVGEEVTKMRIPAGRAHVHPAHAVGL